MAGEDKDNQPRSTCCVLTGCAGYSKASCPTNLYVKVQLNLCQISRFKFFLRKLKPRKCIRAPNETVEKPFFQSTFPGQRLLERPGSRSEGGLTDVSLRQGSVDRPECVDLADVVYQSEQPPLYIHFQLGP